jgi:hypothetical protein
VKGLLTPTWRHAHSRPFLRRAQWGVLVGSAEIFSGLVGVISLGQFTSDLPLNVAFRLTVVQNRRAREDALT